MASVSVDGVPPPITEQHSWKGHPQPPPDERLLAARYFLADEDQDRNLDFAAHISEIEEYVAFLESGRKQGTIQCDPDLLRDVKVKIAVQRDWEKRRKDGIPDIGCSNKPWQLPYSTRTFAAQAPARPNPVQTTNLPLQVREDHPPFSVRREEDHAAFIAALKEDARGDPDEVDPETNLLWTESRAYSWALQEPVLIPSWMHPTQGIPKKGVSLTDPVPWFRQAKLADLAATEQYRPTRGWIPEYLLAREQRINDLLNSELEPEEMTELEDLLHFIEPPELHRLHAETVAFDKDDALGLVTEAEQEQRKKVSDAFATEQQKWLATFSDVYFILKSTANGNSKSEHPGVFYIDHGVLDPGRLAALKQANTLLSRINVAGYAPSNMNDSDIAALEVFLQFSQPDSITNLGRRRAAILRQAGANSKEDLVEVDTQKYEEIHRKEHGERAAWLKSLEIAHPKFRYLRPGEIPEVPENPDLPHILYIPWEIASTPKLKDPILLELTLPSAVQKLQATLRYDLRATKADDAILAGSAGNSLVRKYLQVAYPELRILGYHWLKYREMLESNDHLGREGEKHMEILHPIFIRLFKNWRVGLGGDDLVIKIPRLNQEDERPGLLYCRSAIDDCDHGDDKVKIQALLDLGPRRQIHDTLELQNALIKFQYPAVRHLHNEYISVLGEGKPGLQSRDRLKIKWAEMMERWIKSLEGSIVEIKKSNASILPDNNPSIVYYRGQLGTHSFDPMTPDQMSMFEEHALSSQPMEDFQLSGTAPHSVETYFRRYQDYKRPKDGLIYVLELRSWHSISLGAMHSGIEAWEPETEGHEACSRPETPRSPLDSPDGKLNLLLPQIKGLETEINRIVAILKNDQATRMYSLAMGTSKPVDEKLSDRFHLLLRQFIPCQIQTEITLANALMKQLQIEDPSNSSGTFEYVRERQFQATMTYLSWAREIIEDGVRIRVSPQPLPYSREKQLEFQAHATRSGASFSILGVNEQNPTVSLKRYGIPTDVPTFRAFTLDEQLIVREFERSINSLLGQKAQGGQLSWYENESLLSKLRAILPVSLRDQERTHFAIDKMARQSPLSQEQSEAFWASWEQWNALLEDWIRTIPNGKVIIDTGDNNPEPRTAVTLNVPDISELRNLATPRTQVLPHPVRTMAQELNVFLSKNIEELSPEERAKGDSLLSQWFRPVLFHLQQRLVSHVEEVYFPGGFDLRNSSREADALTKTLLVRCYESYRNALSSLPAVKIEENVPGDFKLVHASILGPDDTNNMSDAMEDERIADKLMETICHDTFTDARREFVTIATKIRRQMELTPHETSTFCKAMAMIAGKSTDETSIGSDSAASLDVRAAQRKALAVINSAIDPLAQDNLDLWTTWLQNLLPPGPLLPGAIQTIAQELLSTGEIRQQLESVNPLPLEPPSVFEIQELQLELNNLLTRQRRNVATSEDTKAVEFLVNEFLSPAMRLLKERMLGSLNHISGSMIHNMGFLEAQRGFRARFQEFMRELHSRFGVVLDSWWYSDAVITASVARWRLWKNTVKNEDGTSKYPRTSKYLELDRQQELFETYALLTDWVSSGCPDSVTDDTQVRLILAALPDIKPSLSTLQAQVRDTTRGVVPTATDSDDSVQAVFLLGIKEELIKSYMSWYSSQSLLELQALRKQYSGTEEGGRVDFTGKAERRGIQRAAIEIGLNLLATNQEQHRPADRFRVLDMSRTHVSLEKEIPISLPLEPSRRQEEQQAFEFTKKMLAYKEWKDYDYEVARDMVIVDSSLIIQPDHESLRTSYGSQVYPEDSQDDTRSYVILDPPINYNGPFALADTTNAMATASRRQEELSTIGIKLQCAYTEAPRPLLENVLSLLVQGMDASQNFRHELYDNVPLTKEDIDLILEIANPSWDETAQDYPDPRYISTDFPGVDLRRLAGFENDLNQMDDIPLWTPKPGAITPSAEEQESSHLIQTQYDPHVESQIGVTLDHLSLAFQKMKGNIPYIHQEMRQFLAVMARWGRVHYDGVQGSELVSRIPYTGHPENKYVTSRGEAFRLPYIKRNDVNQLEVQYDSNGNVGPPIIQPNKYEHFQRTAFRLGRDTLRVLETLQGPIMCPEQTFSDQIFTGEIAKEQMKNVTPEERGQAASISTANLDDINLVNIAREVCTAAPHLAKEYGIDIPYHNPYSSTPPADVELNETEAAALIQLKILEEINNNFEPKFPVDETVWDFANERLATETIVRNGRTILLKPQQTKFFSVRRYPICCQTKATKEAIKNSGPMIQEETVATVMTEEQQRKDDAKAKVKAAEDAALGPVKKARHIRGQRPYYPFGETPYQEAYQSHIMEYELRDVEEFNPKPVGITANIRAGIMNTLTRVFGRAEPILVEPPEDPPIPNDPYPLPRLPADWKPDSISAEEKRLRLIELAKETPGFPNPAIQEYYHTQDEIEFMAIRDEQKRRIAQTARIQAGGGAGRAQRTGASGRRGRGNRMRVGRKPPSASLFAAATTGHTTLRDQAPGTASTASAATIAGSAGSRRRSQVSFDLPVSETGAEQTIEEQEYWASLEANSRVREVREEELSGDEIQFAVNTPPLHVPTSPLKATDRLPGRSPSAADIRMAEKVGRDALGSVADQVIVESELQAQMLKEQADHALRNAERLRDERRLREQKPMEEQARQDYILHASDGEDIEDQNAMDEG